MQSFITFSKWLQQRQSVFLPVIFGLLFLTLPVSNNLNSYSIIVIACYWFFSGHFMNYRQLLDRRVWLQIGMYLLFFIGLFISEDRSHAGFLMQQKFAYIAFPLLFATFPIIPKKTRRAILLLFVAVFVFYSLVCLGRGTYENFYAQQLNYIDIQYFTNQQLSSYINCHSTYFSIYLVFSIGILIFYSTHKNDGLYRYRIGVFLVVIFLVGMLFLLAARMVLIAGLIAAVFFSIRQINQKNYLYFLGGGIVLISCVFFAMQTNYFKERVEELYNIKMDKLIGTNYENGVTQRIFFWTNALEIIKEKPIFGHGSGDVNRVFSKQYSELLQQEGLTFHQRRAIRSFDQQNWNAHNQYIQLLIAFGVFGLLLFLIHYFWFFKDAIQHKKTLFLFFLLIVSLCFLTENLLDRQYGIVFILFFVNFFSFLWGHE